MSDELKPCPHCGNNDYVTVEGTVSSNNFQVVCDWLLGGCGASSGARRTQAEAIAAWNTRADDAPERTCELEEPESYECRRFDTDDPKLYATRLTVHVLECSECGRTCEHVNGTYPRCPYCSAVNVLDENYEPQVIKNAENYKLADDSRPQVIEIGGKYELADSRERLEADIKKYRWEHGETSGRVTEWLDRQAAITRAEVFEDGEYDCRTCGAKRELQERVDSLTAERDELRDKLDEKQHVCDVLSSANDSLHKKLREKQRVCDVQRDSFLKLERENRELQDACGELERTLENIRRVS